MTHFQLFLQNKKRLINIIAFISLLAALSVFIAAVYDERKLSISIIKLALVLVSGYYLMEGKKWGATVLIVLSVLSILQGLLGIIGVQSIASAIYYLLMIISFGYIVWFLSNSQGFDSYLELKNNGFEFNSSSEKRLDEIIDPDRIIRIDHKTITNPEEYSALARQMLEKSGINDRITMITSEDGKLEIETEDSLYELNYNNSLNIFDRNFTFALNKILEELDSERLFHYIWPDSILSSSRESLTVACLLEPEYEELRKNGYAKNS
jgi:hypothetical protein